MASFTTYDQVTAAVLRNPDALLTPGEVASAMRVHPKTVSRWADTGKIRFVRTPGGHRRFYAVDLFPPIPTPEETPVA